LYLYSGARQLITFASELAAGQNLELSWCNRGFYFSRLSPVQVGRAGRLFTQNRNSC
jgi:hypothetical protein